MTEMLAGPFVYVTERSFSAYPGSRDIAKALLLSDKTACIVAV